MIEEWDRQRVVASEWGIANRNGVFRGWSLVQEAASDDFWVMGLNVITDYLRDPESLQHFNEISGPSSRFDPGSHEKFGTTVDESSDHAFSRLNWRVVLLFSRRASITQANLLGLLKLLGVLIYDHLVMLGEGTNKVLPTRVANCRTLS